LHFTAFAVTERHWQKAERCNSGRGQYWPQTRQRTAYDTLSVTSSSPSFFNQLVEVADEDDAVQHGYTEECDETDTGADAEIQSAQ
jgi:hypothetical protein